MYTTCVYPCIVTVYFIMEEQTRKVIIVVYSVCAYIEYSTVIVSEECDRYFETKIVTILWSVHCTVCTSVYIC